MKQTLLVELPDINQTLFEEQLYAEGVSSIAGVDEVGRGCLAGPVVAASVILPRVCKIQGINDSKKLSAKERERLFELILNDAVAFGIGVVDSLEIDKINILQATMKAMRLAVDSMGVKPSYLLIDGKQALKDVSVPQKIIVKGDIRSISVGAASIVAKVTRDRMMGEMEKRFPQFKFSVHKGYGTALHLKELGQNGPTAIHRKTFAGVKT
jgi:ribonuclease HII